MRSHSQFRTAFVLVACLAAGSRAATNSASSDEVLQGFRLQDLTYTGPGEWRHSTDPIWVYDYHRLVLRYRASGLNSSDRAVLLLRPGSVGPVTPGGNNPENPFVSGGLVTAVLARDLVADGAPHELQVDLLPRIRTAQMDQLIFVLPAGAHLNVDHLEFRAEPGVFPCAAAAKTVSLPAGARMLHAASPLSCDGFPATSLRGRESIHIDGAGLSGPTLYLNLMAHFAGLSNFVADTPPDQWRVRESSETTQVVAVIRYAGSPAAAEKQFPLLAGQSRHALLNRQPGLYALALDPRRKLASVDLLDTSPHAQFVLYAAGLSRDPLTSATPPLAPAAPPAQARQGTPVDLAASRWFRVETSNGSPVDAGAVHTDYQCTEQPQGKLLTLSVTNTGKAALELKVVFPSLAAVASQDPDDVYYVFPSKAANIGRAATTLSAAYGPDFLLQFVDVFAPAANRGVCTVVHDTTGQLKTFRLSKNGATVQAEVEYTVRLAPGENFRAPDASIVFHGGDWHEGFQAYRDWVHSWYRRAGVRSKWLPSAPYARRDYPVGGTDLLFDQAHKVYSFSKLIEDAKAFGGIDLIDISGWALSNRYGRVGDYPIELGGPDDLRRNIDQATRQGIATGLYFEGYLIDKNSSVGSQFGSKWQLVGKDGQGVWWPGGSPELFVCPHVPEWQNYLAGRMAAVARQVGAQAVYLDEFGCRTEGRQCYSTEHGHQPGIGPVAGEIAVAKTVRRALDSAGMADTIIYAECNPVDAAAPYFDAAFCYAVPRTTTPQPESVRLNLWRFVFPDLPVWEMVTSGIYPRSFSAENFRLALWHGDGMWLKGRSDTWYGDDLLAFIQRARRELKEHAAAFRGAADPLVSSPDPAILVNRFVGGGETVYTLFNSSYRTVQLNFQGAHRTIAPREVEVVAVRR